MLRRGLQRWRALPAWQCAIVWHVLVFILVIIGMGLWSLRPRPSAVSSPVSVSVVTAQTHLSAPPPSPTAQRAAQAAIARQRRQREKRAQQLAAKRQLAQRLEKKREQALARQRALALKKKQAAVLLAQKKRLQAQKKQAQIKQSIAQALQREQQNLRAEKIAREQLTALQNAQAKIIAAISAQWVYPRDINKNASSLLKIWLGAGGRVVRVALLQSSGFPALDRSAIAAVYRASPLPLPDDVSLSQKFKRFELRVQPPAF